MTEKQRPLAVCTDCISYSYSVDNIGKQCPVERAGRRCQGIMVDVTNPINWKECSACFGTGMMASEPCIACQASGWLLTRRR